MAKATPTKSNDFYAIQTSQKDAEDRTRIHSVWLASVVPSPPSSVNQTSTCFNIRETIKTFKTTQTLFQRLPQTHLKETWFNIVLSPVLGTRLSPLMSGQPPQTWALLCPQFKGLFPLGVCFHSHWINLGTCFFKFIRASKATGPCSIELKR
jgi:hypothetical protein